MADIQTTDVLFPIRCYSCNKVLADKQERYEQFLRDGKSIKEAMDILGIKRECCRGNVISAIQRPVYAGLPEDSMVEQTRLPIEDLNRKLETMSIESPVMANFNNSLGIMINPGQQTVQSSSTSPSLLSFIPSRFSTPIQPISISLSQRPSTSTTLPITELPISISSLPPLPSYLTLPQETSGQYLTYMAI